MKCVHQGALRLVERFRKMCKEAIEDDPLQPVAIIYEENLSKIKRDLGTAGVEPTEFEALVPNFLAMAPSLYRWFIILFSPVIFLHCPLHLCVQLLLPGTLRPPVILPPLPFVLMCPPFAALYLEANIVFPPFPPKYVFVVQSMCSYCISFQFLFALSLFNSLTVSLISFLIV